jgi:hypothetical protein
LLFSLVCYFLRFVGVAVFLLLDDIFKLFFGFWSSSCASGVLDLVFKLFPFVLSMERLRNQLSVPWFDCDESLTCRGFNSNLRYFGGSTTFILVSCGESCLFISWYVGDRYYMAGSDEDHGKSRKPGAENWGWSHGSGTQ